MPWAPRKTYASHRLRKGRTSLCGQIYLVTFATRDRVGLFNDHRLAGRFSAACADSRLWQKADLLAWVLMPDHWHGLIRLSDGGDLSRTVQRLKANTARAVGPGGRVWQPGFHDHAIRDERAVHAAADYLLANPLRAGLVDQIEDWPWRFAMWDRIVGP